MTQQSIFGRIAQLARANVNALIDQAEDPQKMLDQMVRDYTGVIADAEGAVAQTIANLRVIEQDAREAQAVGAQWAAKAAAASAKADDMRVAGNLAEAERFDDLARIALRRQIDGEKDVINLAHAIADQSAVVDRLTDGLGQMRGKLDELRRKRDELVARDKTVKARDKMRDAIRSVDILDPASEVARFEEKVRREEAKVVGQQELDASSLDRQFESLEDLGTQTEIEARLAALKGGELTATPTSTKAIGN
jgi:phage shock protein A